MSQQPEDTLTAAYRRASEADAGPPAAATRRAILAQAAAMAATRRAPAANDSRYWPRMVAGIAVLGVGLLLWKQMDHRIVGDAPEVVLAPTTEAEVELAPESTGATTQVVPRSAAVPSPPAPSPVEPTRAMPAPPPPPPPPATPDPFPDSPRMTEAAPPQSVTAPAAPPLLAGNQAEVVEDNERSEVAVTGTRMTPGSARAEAPRGGPPRAGQPPRAGGAGAARAGGPGGGRPPGQASSQDVDRAALLRQYFPAQFQSDAPHSLWLVQNAAGEVELSGELAPGQLLEDLAPQIARALGGRLPAPWQTATVRNARGQPITLAIGRLP